MNCCSVFDEMYTTKQWHEEVENTLTTMKTTLTTMENNGEINLRSFPSEMCDGQYLYILFIITQKNVVVLLLLIIIMWMMLLTGMKK